MYPSIHCSTAFNSQDTEATDLSTDRGVDKEVWYIHTVEYYSATKKNKIMPSAATRMDLEILILSEISQRKTNIIWYCLYVESKNNGTDELIYKTEIESRMWKTNLWLPGGKGINWEIGTDIYTLLYMKQTTKKDLLYGTGNSTLYSLITYRGKESSGLPPGVCRWLPILMAGEGRRRDK